MKHRQTALCLAATILLSCLPLPSSAESQLDISACAKEVMYQHQADTTYGKLQLAFLARITESNYEMNARDANQVAAGIANGNYSDFVKERDDLFSQVQLSEDYYESVALSSSVYSAVDSAQIQRCLKTVAATQLGLHYLAAVEDSNNATLQVFWIPLTEARRLKVRDSTLENASVIGKKVRKGRLFPFNTAITMDGPLIALRRIDSDKPIRASFRTGSPAKIVATVLIPPLPREPTLETHYRDQIITETFLESSILGGFLPERRARRFSVVKQAAGPVLGMSCSWPSGVEGHSLEKCSVESVGSRQARCEGSTSGESPYTLTMTVVYSQPYTICTSNCGDSLKERNQQEDRMDSSTDLFKAAGVLPRTDPLSASGKSENKESCSWQRGTVTYHHLTQNRSGDIP